MPSNKRLRIAILGFSLEANRSAPISDKKAFTETHYLDSEGIRKELEGDFGGVRADIHGFCQQMDKNGVWDAVPITIAEAPPGGPADHKFFLEFLEEVRTGLIRVGEVDGVIISEHGAGLTTEEDDPDGVVFSLVREIVGPDVPVIAILDLHGHVTQRMHSSVDILISYLTNPHIDQFERGLEAADHMLLMLNGTKTTSSFIKVPMVSPSVSLLTDEGSYADLIRSGQEILKNNKDHILNISILGGFAPANANTNGMSIVVTGKAHHLESKKIVEEAAFFLAKSAWRDRKKYTTNLITLNDMISLSKKVVSDPNEPQIIIADVADNPGGGGRGNTLYALKRMLEEKIENATLGMIVDADLAEDAHKTGIGKKFKARFNRNEKTKFSEKYEVDALVISLARGNCVGRRGTYANRRVDLGFCALLQIDGITVAVSSGRHQLADPEFIERLGVDLSSVRVLVVKSRGHFRAGFDEFFNPKQIFEVDLPGLTTPNLYQLDLSRVPRPIFPLDPDMSWQPPK